MPLERHVRIKAPTVIHEIIDDEVVIIHFDSGNYYSLNGVGVDVWRFIEAESTHDEIISGITSLYRDGEENIDDAVSFLIEELEKEDLVEFIEKGSSATDADNPYRIKHDLGAEMAVFTPPVLNKFTDMKELLLLDPIHEVDEAGWPSKVIVEQTE
jgi:hypothetical protein